MERKLNTQSYADDVAVIYDTAEGLRKLIEFSQNNCEIYKLKWTLMKLK